LNFSVANCLSQTFSLTNLPLGDSIQKYYGKIECGEAGPRGKIHFDSCRTFQFLPTKDDPVKIGTVEFPGMFLAINDGNPRISLIMLLKSYSFNDSISVRDLTASEYKNLRSYIESVLKKRGRKYKPEWNKNKDNFEDGTVWEVAGYKYYITKTKYIRKSPQQNLAYTLNLTIEK
jgi:hypothetical protein